jgi:hypothetical protein
MTAPALALEIATPCADAYAPAGGENVGVAARGMLIVYVAERTALSA